MKSPHSISQISEDDVANTEIQFGWTYGGWSESQDSYLNVSQALPRLKVLALPLRFPDIDEVTALFWIFDS